VAIAWNRGCFAARSEILYALCKHFHSKKVERFPRGKTWRAILQMQPDGGFLPQSSKPHTSLFEPSTTATPVTSRYTPSRKPLALCTTKCLNSHCTSLAPQPR
jgi:hypothetical protein